jgi:prepilin-type N-terminal cleavage/methylation domain-containing protein
VKRRRGGDGFSLPEVVLALALLGLMLLVAAPALGAALQRGRVVAAAREMAGEMARMRAEAIASRRRVAMRFTTAGGRPAWSFYADGDGDGVRADDIAAGRDPLLAGPRDLPSRYEGTDFGLLDIPIPAVPPTSGTIAPGDDPIRFGSSSTVTFTPWGTASSGTLYISDGRESVCAVVLYGHTGRIRTWRFDRALGRWTQ